MSVAARLLKTRWLMRAPIGLYRAGFGWLLGPRFLLLEHRGRVSGRSRFVVLEVVWRERRDSLVVASAFGAKSQWFRNLSANPNCRVSTGMRQRMPAVAAVIPADEGKMILAQYRRRYPRTWVKLLAVIRAATGDENPNIPLVRLQLDRDERVRSFPRAWSTGTLDGMDTASMIMGGAIASVFWIAMLPMLRRRSTRDDKSSAPEA